MSYRTIRLSGGPYNGQIKRIYEGDKIQIDGALYKRSPHEAYLFIFHPPKTITMNAQECYDAVIKARNEQANKVKEKIFSSIYTAVQSNEFYFTYDGTITKELRFELEAAGFKVSGDVHRNESFTTISWDLS